MIPAESLKKYAANQIWEVDVNNSGRAKSGSKRKKVHAASPICKVVVNNGGRVETG